MNPRKALEQRKARRTNRTRAKLFGTSLRPRLVVFRSNKYVYAQLVDDEAGKTIVSGSTRELSKEKKKKAEQAKTLGELLAKKALAKDVKAAVFDRRSYKYHGRVSAVAEGARNGGLKV